VSAVNTKLIVCPPLLYNTELTTTTVLRPFFQEHPGARRELLDFVVQGKINRGRHTDHPGGRHSITTNQCPPPPSPILFYRPVLWRCWLGGRKGVRPGQDIT